MLKFMIVFVMHGSCVFNFGSLWHARFVRCDLATCGMHYLCVFILASMYGISCVVNVIVVSVPEYYAVRYALAIVWAVCARVPGMCASVDTLVLSLLCTCTSVGAALRWTYWPN